MFETRFAHRLGYRRRGLAMRCFGPSLAPLALLVAALGLAACAKKEASQSPETKPEASSPEQAEAPMPSESSTPDTSCEQIVINEDVVRVHNHALDYSFVAILPPLRVDCEDPESVLVQNHDGLVEWSLTAIGTREPLDEQAFLEALWRKNEANSGARRRVFGGGLEVTPKGHVVLSYLALEPGPAGAEPKATVVFVNLRQRPNGDAFLLRMVAQVEPQADPELSRARMRGPFMPLLDEFRLGEAAGR